MKIILKENDFGLFALYDTRSEKFLPNPLTPKGWCTKYPPGSSSADEILNTANQIVRKPFKNILELAQSMEYLDNGYLECKLAKAYVDINPDLKEKVLEKLNKPKVNKKMVIKGKRGRKPKAEKVKVLETASVGKKRGRPKKVV